MLAFDANMYERWGQEQFLLGARAYEEREQLAQAIQVIKETATRAEQVGELRGLLQRAAKVFGAAGWVTRANLMRFDPELEKELREVTSC